jgi:2-keto-4-pentenoate hydratase/2-oxohepta-3-ene-1,7-dioic acid hydratase in catechol pathway
MLAAMTDAAKGGKYEPVSHPLGTARLHAPIADPGKFICIGLNYKDHAAETNNPAPKEPPIFPKWSNAIADPGEPVLRPRGEKTFDWEVELGVVIGRTARFVKREQALDYVFGYTIINDVSARDFQFHTSQWSAGKIADTLAPVGPYIADRAEIPDPHVLDLKTWVNGTLMQNGTTRNFIFDVGYIIQYLTNIMTLAPGDLIATGTPAGVGFSRKPQITLQPGDTMRLEISGLGALENTVKDALDIGGGDAGPLRTSPKEPDCAGETGARTGRLHWLSPTGSQDTRRVDHGGEIVSALCAGGAGPGGRAAVLRGLWPRRRHGRGQGRAPQAGAPGPRNRAPVRGATQAAAPPVLRGHRRGLLPGAGDTPRGRRERDRSTAGRSRGRDVDPRS